MTLAVFFLSTIIGGCMGGSEAPVQSSVQAEIKRVDYTCENLAEARPRILATLRQAGLGDTIVKVATDSELLVISQLTAKDQKTEAIAKFSTIVAAVAKFAAEGHVKVIFLSDRAEETQSASLSCEIANARAVRSGSMEWPDFVKTIEFGAGVN